MKTLTKAELENILTFSGVDLCVGKCADCLYVLPTGHWVSTKFSQALASFCHAFNVSRPTTSNDCDNFTDYARVFAQILHQNTPGRIDGSALALGSMWIKQKSTRLGHSITAFITEEDDESVLAFFDPINKWIVDLSIEEVVSCFDYRF